MSQFDEARQSLVEKTQNTEVSKLAPEQTSKLGFIQQRLELCQCA